jgi:hypothetical protein
VRVSRGAVGDRTCEWAAKCSAVAAASPRHLSPYRCTFFRERSGSFSVVVAPSVLPAAPRYARDKGAGTGSRRVRLDVKFTVGPVRNVYGRSTFIHASVLCVMRFRACEALVRLYGKNERCSLSLRVTGCQGAIVNARKQQNSLQRSQARSATPVSRSCDSEPSGEGIWRWHIQP